MTGDRSVSAAEYRALIAAGGTTSRSPQAAAPKFGTSGSKKENVPKSHGSARGSQGSSVGECALCGRHVGAKDEAWFHHPDCVLGGGPWVVHLACWRNDRVALRARLMPIPDTAKPQVGE